MHQTPIRSQCNYMYVLIRNRGTQEARDVSVRTYHRAFGRKLVWPSGMQSTHTAVLPLASDPPMSIPPGGQSVIGPFAWIPTTDEDQLLASVSAFGDLSNIDPSSPLPVNSGPTALNRLVPFDNNIAQLAVQPASNYPVKRLMVRSRIRGASRLRYPKMRSR